MPLVRSQSAKLLSLWRCQRPVTRADVTLLLGSGSLGLALQLLLF